MMFEQLAFLPIVAPLFSAALIMGSKTISSITVKNILFHIAIAIAFIVSLTITLIVGFYTYQHGNIENVIGSSGDDTFTGNSDSNIFLGADGDDTFLITGASAGSESDTLNGGNNSATGDTVDFSGVTNPAYYVDVNLASQDLLLKDASNNIVRDDTVLNIESLNTSPSEIEGVSKFTVVVNMNEEGIKKIIGQIEKQVEVIKAYYHNLDDIIYQIAGLFKIKSELLFEERKIQNIIKESNARIVTVNKEFFVLEKSGKKEEIVDLYNQLAPFGIMQYTRSGLIAVTKEEMRISKMLENLE